MNTETYRIYDDPDEIEAAEQRGEPLVFLRQGVIEALRDVEKQTLEQVMGQRFTRMEERLAAASKIRASRHP